MSGQKVIKKCSNIRELIKNAYWCELLYVIIKARQDTGSELLAALGDLPVGEEVRFLDVENIDDKGSQPLVMYTQDESRENPAHVGRRRLPYVISCIYGIGVLDSATDVTEIGKLLRYSRDKKEKCMPSIRMRMWWHPLIKLLR